MSEPMAPAAATRLVSFVPRLTIEWLREEPRSQWREVDGTLAFVDISGFTAMSERLSSRGRAGAEEVTDVMNSTFAALLEIAYSFGGGLLKFGGDALLLLFTGDDHAARAARASFQMRRRLRAIGRPRTSGGVVELRMHVGLHSGHFHFFLVGDSHLELLVSGPAATRTVEMESASEAGEILLSAESAAALGADGLVEQTTAGFLLKKEPDVAGDLDPLPDVSGVPIELAVPSPLRTQLLEIGPLEGEHRNAVIAFVRYGGIDELIAREGPAAAAESIASLVLRIQAAADEHGVTFLESDVDRDGGRIVLVAGAPATAGDDEERMLRALRSMVDAGLPLPVHIGASRGRVFAGQVGASFRRTYTILGDTAALAARLMARAPANEIWVSAEAFERSGGHFSATELEPFTVKGKSEPVRAVTLGALTAAEAPRRDRKLPFVDRERERAVLAASVAPVRMGFGTLVELIGEPGIGKSRLSEELREQCGDMRALTARCEQYEASTPYHAFGPLLRSLLDVELNGGGGHNRDVLSERLREIDPELVPWTPLLAAPLDVDIDPTPEVDELDRSFRRARLHGVVGSLLGGLLDAPTLMVFEDVQWMDEASSELLRHLGTQLSSRPWLTCTTRRPTAGGFLAAEGTPPLPAMTLRLEPLPPEDAKALVQAAADRVLSDEDIRAIAERAAGNPLFLQELARRTRSRARRRRSFPKPSRRSSRRGSTAWRPPTARSCGGHPCSGPSFSAAVISDVLVDDRVGRVRLGGLGPPGRVHRARSRRRRRVPVPARTDPRRRLRGPLVPSAPRAPRPRRGGGGGARRRVRRGRRRAALAALPACRSLRWRRGGTPSIAGHRAREKWSNVEAAEFYRRALDAAPAVPNLTSDEVAACGRRSATSCSCPAISTRRGRSFAAARRLLPKDDPEQVVLMRKEGALRELRGRYSEALRWYGRGLRAAEGLADEAVRTRTQIRFRLAHAQVRFRQGAFRECISGCRAGRRGGARQWTTPRTLRPHTCLLHLVHTMLGTPDRAAFRGLALPLYEELGDLSGQASCAQQHGDRGLLRG